ncbi:hypothetical protein SAMN02949497_1630 [Methylomagnum ishizawai]|uniref:Uncharacterized protein n=1 Tax=Methylomagnum ishizawai TaxID=1760988 RepID=A0A1Y6CVR6_9GAMM|nr:hypothetical protein [Methylomagnum ishizawai]SMF94320.1 hypothetical protein SAMN02949497_1630 [Methylomagnum ishizawai]
MNVSFDFNVWSAIALVLNFGLAIYGISSARGRATANALDTHKEKTGMTFQRLGERVQALETEVKNSITHDDLSAVHRRVDTVLEEIRKTNQSMGRIEGYLEAMGKPK